MNKTCLESQLYFDPFAIINPLVNTAEHIQWPVNTEINGDTGQDTQ
jgi:hypothetical protein